MGEKTVESVFIQGNCLKYVYFSRFSRWRNAIIFGRRTTWFAK